MTPDERTLALAIDPAKVTYCPGVRTKRFAREMAHRVQMDAAEKPLTPNQRRYLIQVAIKFRRPIPREVVALARQMEAADRAAQEMQP